MSLSPLGRQALGTQIPRICVAPEPEGYNSNHGEDAVEYAGFYGLTADQWQATVVQTWMRQTPLGRWAASTWCVTVSRQNGKNGSLEIVELYGMAELGLRFLHTAHEVKTARKAFRRLKHFFGEKPNDPNAKYPELNALVVEVRNTNGQEAIELHNGASIEFIARSKGSGRGFTVDVLVCDEAQDLQDTELEALQPTISAAPSGDPVTIFMGTPPADTGALGEPFIRARNGAIDGTNPRIAWVEFSAPGDVDAMTVPQLEAFVRDRANWAAGNPAWGTRINEDTILTELNMFSARSFARERLNMFPAAGGASAAISKKSWDPLKITEVGQDWPVLAYGLDMNHERTKVTIAVAVDSGEMGPVHLELAVEAPFDNEGTSALVEWLWERAKRRVPIVIDALSPAASISAHLKRKKMKVFILGAAEFTQACAGLYDAATKDKSITHLGQKPLNESLAGTYKDFIGRDKTGVFKWNRTSLEVDLGPTIAITCAYFGAVKFARRVPSSSGRKRAAVIT